MFNLFKIEFYKLKKLKTFYIFIVLSLLQIIPIYYFGGSLKGLNGKETLAYMLFIQSNLGTNILMGAFVGYFIVNEFTSGYIKNLIANGHKRCNIFLSKSIVCYLGSTVIALLPAIVMMLINIHKLGCGERFTINSAMHLVRILMLATITYLGVVSITILLSFLIRRNTAISIIILALDFINRILNIMIVKIPSLEWVLSKTTYMQPVASLSKEATSKYMIQGIIVSSLTIILTTIIGIYSFEKSEIK